MYGYIYKTTNLINGKIYIGKHRAKQFDIKYFGSGIILKNAIKKYGIENFVCEMLESCDSLAQLNEREVYWIEKFNSQRAEIGYNISNGGDGLSPMPEHVKDKIRQANLGKKYSLASREKRRKSNLGKHHLNSEQIKLLAEARRKSGCYSKRKPMAEETKRKISAANKHPNGYVWINDGANNKKVLKADANNYLVNGFVLGRIVHWETHPKKKNCSI